MLAESALCTFPPPSWQSCSRGKWLPVSKSPFPAQTQGPQRELGSPTTASPDCCAPPVASPSAPWVAVSRRRASRLVTQPPPRGCPFSLSLSLCRAGIGPSWGVSRHPCSPCCPHHVLSQKRLCCTLTFLSSPWVQCTASGKPACPWARDLQALACGHHVPTPRWSRFLSRSARP